MHSVELDLRDQRLLRQLGSVDWDFPASLPGSSEPFHWYPGTFPSQLPATVIEALSAPGELVFDPYAGVGTAAIEAVRLGRRARCVEMNPVGALTTYVGACLYLLWRINPNLALLQLEAVERRINSRLVPLSISEDLIGLDDAEREVDSHLRLLAYPTPEIVVQTYKAPPRWELMERWYEPSTLTQFKALAGAGGDAQGAAFGRLLLLAMISSVLRAGCSQNKSWGHIADNVAPRSLTNKNVSKLARRWLGQVRRQLKNCRAAGVPSSDVTHLFVANHNWKTGVGPEPLLDQQAGLLVTSPPYGGAIDYTLAQRLSLYFFGFDDSTLSSMVATEIGARRKRFLATSRAGWAEELEEALALQLSGVNDGGFVCLVLPHKDAGREEGQNRVGDLLERKGWVPMFETERSIRQLRARQNWTSIKKEVILIFRKDRT